MTGELLNISLGCSVEWLRPGGLECDDVERQGITQPVLGSLHPGVRQPEREPDHLLFFVIKPTRCTNFRNLFCNETLHLIS
jgi:hypothetical protein